MNARKTGYKVRIGASINPVLPWVVFEHSIYSLFIHPIGSDENMSSTTREQVLQLLALEPAGLSAPELVRRIRPRISQPTLWRTLDGLRNEGRIAAQGRARATRYHATTRIDLPALRSLRLHQVAARRIAAHPEKRSIAHQRLRKLRAANPHGRVYQDRWAALLDGPLPSLLRTMTETSEQADALRKESPMTVLVTPAERRRVFADVRTA
jgi:hypothetical protein